MIFMNAVSDRPCTLILNGFDRSGGSALARTLATHPKVELFMQPFNSGPVRQKMYELWKDDTASPEDIRFFAGLERGHLQRDYIRSHWFAESSVQEFVPGHLHVIKTTLNHFVTGWSMRRFPGIAHWALWREPRDMLASLIRNDFIDAWYASAIGEIRPAILQDPELNDRFAKYLPLIDKHEQLQAAFLIAVRSTVLFREVPAQNVLSFEAFATDPTRECAHLFTACGLEALPVDNRSDGNLTGKHYQPGLSHIENIDPAILPLADEMFDHIAHFRPVRAAG